MDPPRSNDQEQEQPQSDGRLGEPATTMPAATGYQRSHARPASHWLDQLVCPAEDLGGSPAGYTTAMWLSFGRQGSAGIRVLGCDTRSWSATRRVCLNMIRL